MNIKSIIYVVGPPRSGSTLVYNSICSSKFFNPSLPENHLTSNLVKYFISQLNRNQSKEKNLIFNSNDNVRSYFKQCIEIFYERIASKYKTENLCLKSINIASSIQILNIILPNINYVMMIRDPRDIIASLLNISKKQIDISQTPQYPRNMKILSEFINEKYSNYFKNINSEFYKNSVFLLKYEDFVLDQKKTLNKIMNKFNLNFLFEDNHDYWDNSLNMNREKNNPYDSDLWNKPASSKKIGSYENFLSAGEIDEVNIYCSELINFFKY